MLILVNVADEVGLDGIVEALERIDASARGACVELTESDLTLLVAGLDAHAYETADQNERSNACATFAYSRCSDHACKATCERTEEHGTIRAAWALAEKLATVQP